MKKNNFKKYHDIIPKRSLRKNKTDVELGADYLDLTASDINTDALKSSQLVSLSEKTLEKKLSKKK